MYIKPIGAFLKGMLNYKSGALVISSTWLAAIIEFVTNGRFLGVSVAFLLLISALYIVDFFTGVVASRHEGEKLKSSKISYTFLKFLVLFIWLCLSYQIQVFIGNSEWLQFLVSTVATFPLVLISLREFVSIGENIERIHGTKPYIFNLVEKIFDAVERLLLRRIDESDATK